MAQGLVVKTPDGKWALTKAGQAEAERIIRSLGQREDVQ
jgi:Mn-dependent DtxR family transcriptional regulator